MKSPYQIAKELNVSPQAVYQKIERMQERLNKHIQRNGKKMLIDEQGENLIKSSFSNIVEQAVKQVIKQEIEQPIEQALNNELNKQLNSENSFLRTRIETLEEELKTERTHNRSQADRLANLAEQLAELSRNNQILLGAEQSRTNPALLMGDKESAQGEEQPIKKKSFWSLFKKT